jgi:hypothetical protein
MNTPSRRTPRGRLRDRRNKRDRWSETGAGGGPLGGLGDSNCDDQADAEQNQVAGRTAQ